MSIEAAQAAAEVFFPEDPTTVRSFHKNGLETVLIGEIKSVRLTEEGRKGLGEYRGILEGLIPENREMRRKAAQEKRAAWEQFMREREIEGK